jgi:Winged helix DNA-binding domain
VLRPGPGPQRDLYQPAPLGARPPPSGGRAALRTLVKRYLYAYGPATPAHFARWLGIPPRYATVLFGRLAGELECVDLEGQPPGSTASSTTRPAS